MHRIVLDRLCHLDNCQLCRAMGAQVRHGGNQAGVINPFRIDFDELTLRDILISDVQSR